MALANPVQTWETDAGFAPDDIDIDRVAGDVLRYKVVPNNVDARTANSVALKKLLAASGRSRFEGRLRFANTTGSDTYHFDDFVEIKDGVHIDLQGCTLAFTKTYAPADDTKGFLMFVGDVTIENGAIDIHYDGRAGINAGMALRVGSRNGYAFGSSARGIREESLAKPMGNIVVRGLGITTTIPRPSCSSSAASKTFRSRTCTSTGRAGRPAASTTSSASGITRRAPRVASHRTRAISACEIHIKPMDAAAGLGMGIVGAMSARVHGLWVDGAFDALDCRSGEALYYNVGPPYQNGRPHLVLENINCTNIGGTGIALTGGSRRTPAISLRSSPALRTDPGLQRRQIGSALPRQLLCRCTRFRTEGLRSGDRAQRIALRFVRERSTGPDR